MLGYKNYSDYALEFCIAKNPQNVDVFLKNLTKKLRPLLEKEYEILLGYKKDEVYRNKYHFLNIFIIY
jgi:Zn-dependent oligopeptidase